MTENTVLRPYSLTEEVVVTTDGSEHTVGGILSKNGKPVICVSRSLSSAERNYSNVEREGLAIVWTLERLRQLIDNFDRSSAITQNIRWKIVTQNSLFSSCTLGE